MRILLFLKTWEKRGGFIGVAPWKNFQELEIDQLSLIRSSTVTFFLSVGDGLASGPVVFLAFAASAFLSVSVFGACADTVTVSLMTEVFASEGGSAAAGVEDVCADGT